MSSSAIVFGQTDVSLQGAVGFKNRIINGDFRVHQRGGTISTGVGALTYTLDRWIVAATTGALLVSQGNQTSYPYNYLLISGAASNTAWSIRQRIEARNIRDLAGKQVTISFYLYNANGGNASNVNLTVASADASDNHTAQTNVLVQSVSVSSTAKQTVTLTLTSACRNGIEIRFSSASGITSGDLVLHTVQLEEGTIATPFENRPVGTELALCQRYYVRFVGGLNSFFGVGQVSNATQVVGYLTFPIPMRVVPSGLETTSTASNYRCTNSTTGVVNCTSLPAYNAANLTGATVLLTASALGGTSGFVSLIGTDGTGFLGFSSEL